MAVNFDFKAKDSMKTFISIRVAGIMLVAIIISSVAGIFVNNWLLSDTLQNYNISDPQVIDAILADTTKTTLIMGGISFITCSIGLFIIYKVIGKMATLLNNFRIHYELVAEGDLFYRIRKRHHMRKDELGAIARATDDMQVRIMETITDIEKSASAVDGQANNLAEIASQLHLYSNNITSSIHSINSSIYQETDEIVHIVGKLEDFHKNLSNRVSDIQTVSHMVDTVQDQSHRSADDMMKLQHSFAEFKSIFTSFSQTIGEMKDNIQKVNDITSLINNIAGQTNLLALNAAIEASRAGEAGKGFSVVATEIRKLSEQTRESSVNINDLIDKVLDNSTSLVTVTSNLSTKLDVQSDTIQQSLHAFGEITDAVVTIAPKMSYLASSSEDILSSNSYILSKMETISGISEEVLALSEQIKTDANQMLSSSEMVSSTADHLQQAANTTTKTIGRFNLEDPKGEYKVS
ncbi:MAG: methyl-accepting chemotaxis protein [Bacilli bacterium]